MLMQVPACFNLTSHKKLKKNMQIGATMYVVDVSYQRVVVAGIFINLNLSDFKNINSNPKR